MWQDSQECPESMKSAANRCRNDSGVPGTSLRLIFAHFGTWLLPQCSSLFMQRSLQVHGPGAFHWCVCVFLAAIGHALKILILKRLMLPGSRSCVHMSSGSDLHCVSHVTVVCNVWLFDYYYYFCSYYLCGLFCPSVMSSGVYLFLENHIWHLCKCGLIHPHW